MMAERLLDIEDLQVRFRGRRRSVHAVNGVSLSVAPGESLGVVGESGCGKSTLALALMGLHDRRQAELTGQVRLDGEELLGMSTRQWQAVRGRRIAMIFQDPMTSLNPYLTVGRQLTEPLERHLSYSPAQARARAIELLASVGLPNPAGRLNQHPHEFSGGMRQRVMIAIALACEPEVLVADEPTTALDVTIQAQIMALIREQVQEQQMGLILITHDLGVVAGSCDRLAVMYAGLVVEEGRVDDVFAAPQHPYTQALLRAVPRVDRPDAKLVAIAGAPPNLAQPPVSCPFAPRCDLATAACRQDVPAWRQVGETHRHRCRERAEVPLP